MPLLVPNVPVQRNTPELRIDSRELGVGEHRLELVVTDDTGQRSTPARWRLVVRPPTRPVAVVTPPDRIVMNRPFRLSASLSQDAPGRRLVEFQWQLAAGAEPAISRITEAPFLSVPAIPTPGTLRVTLVVRNDQGVLSDPTTQELIVNPD